MAKNTLLKEPWLKWAIEIQSIAQNGLAYVRDEYDRERYEQLRDIAAEMLSYQSDIPKETVKSLFCCDEGYQTPKIDTRAAIFQDGKILLVQEKNGTWSLPGGWVDVLESVESNTIKEVKEEAGLNVKPVRIIALQDRKKHNIPVSAYGICKVFVLCDLIDGEFVPNLETINSGYFDLNSLPNLAVEKTTYDQIKMCFDASKDDNWVTQFD